MDSPSGRKALRAGGVRLLRCTAILLWLCLYIPAASSQDGDAKASDRRYKLANWAIVLICLGVVAAVLLIVLCAFAVAYCASASSRSWTDFRAYFTHMAP